MALETPRPEIKPTEREVPLTAEEKNFKQELEFSLSLKDYYNAAINAIRLARNHPTYIKIADNCASYLYHEQGRYSTAAEIYLDIADYYKDIGMPDKYEKNMNYAASSYIQAADKILNYSVKGDSDEEIIRYYLQNAFNIYTELNRQDLAKMVETRLKELGTPTRGE